MMRWVAHFWILFLLGCTSVPGLSPAERRSLQMRTFQRTTYENVFRAFGAVLQASGYVIKKQEMTRGLIVAQMPGGGSDSSLATTGGSEKPRVSQPIEVSVNLEKVNLSTIETRMIIQTEASSLMSGQQSREILDEKRYKSIYDSVRIEVERHLIQGKSQ